MMGRNKRLVAVRETIRARMEAGELMDWHGIWRIADSSPCWARKVLWQWHADGLIHITKYRRGDAGDYRPLYSWGPGQDARRPKALTAAQKCKRWRKAHPDKVAVAKKRAVFRNRTTPMLDPIVAALTGYHRRGPSWVKRRRKEPECPPT